MGEQKQFRGRAVTRAPADPERAARNQRAVRQMVQRRQAGLGLAIGRALSQLDRERPARARGRS